MRLKLQANILNIIKDYDQPIKRAGGKMSQFCQKVQEIFTTESVWGEHLKYE